MLENATTHRPSPYRPQRKRLRRDRPPFALQDRDLAILRAVWLSRVLTRKLLASLFPPAGGNPEGDHTRLARRLQAMFHAGYLDRLASPETKELVYALGPHGAKELLTRGESVEATDWAEKNRRLSPFFIEHALVVARLRTALTVALRDAPWIELERFERDSQKLRAEWTPKRGPRDERRVLRPDAFFVLRDRSAPEGRQRRAFAVEADRSTMDLRRFAFKVSSYIDCYASAPGAFGVPRFLVLSVTKSPQRAQNILSLIQREVPDDWRRLFLLTDEPRYASQLSNVLAAIWRGADAPEAPRGIIPSPLPIRSSEARLRASGGDL